MTLEQFRKQMTNNLTDEQERDLIYALENAFEQLEHDDLHNFKLNGDLKNTCNILKKYGMCENDRKRI